MKAVMLLSGGLDSCLALKLLLDQNIEVTALHFASSFCRCDGRDKACGSAAKTISDSLNVTIKNIFLTDDYFEIIKNPKHGYGKNMNPCIDCRILKFKYAKKFMEEIGASFIVTGEVVGQRPKSQHKPTMELIEKKAGLEGLVLRPLTAKLLPPTIPETNGWVDREKCLDINGRSRKPQIKLAHDYGINDYPCPAGGCLLTERNFCRRLKDLLDYGTFDLNNIELLKIGRHFRITPSFKLIVGRDEHENNRLLYFKQNANIIFGPGELKGPTALGIGSYDETSKYIAAQIMAMYLVSDNKMGEIPVQVTTGNTQETLFVNKQEEAELRALML